MSGDASWNVQQRIYAVLTAAPALAGGKVYDAVPAATSAATAPDTAFPYIQIGEMDAIPDDVLTDDESPRSDDGQSETLTLHFWSRYAGQKEVKQLMDGAKTRLHSLNLNVSGRSSAIAWVRSMRNFLDPDGKTRHGVMSVEVVHRS